MVEPQKESENFGKRGALNYLFLLGGRMVVDGMKSEKRQ